MQRLGAASPPIGSRKSDLGPRISDLGSQTSELWARGKGIIVSRYFESAILGLSVELEQQH